MGGALRPRRVAAVKLLASRTRDTGEKERAAVGKAAVADPAPRRLRSSLRGFSSAELPHVAVERAVGAGTRWTQHDLLMSQHVRGRRRSRNPGRTEKPWWCGGRRSRLSDIHRPIGTEGEPARELESRREHRRGRDRDGLGRRGAGGTQSGWGGRREGLVGLRGRVTARHGGDAGQRREQQEVSNLRPRRHQTVRWASRGAIANLARVGRRPTAPGCANRPGIPAPADCGSRARAVSSCSVDRGHPRAA